MSEHDERVEALAKVIAEAWGTDIDLPPEADPYDEAPDYFDDVARHLLASTAMRDLLAAERAKALREAASQADVLRSLARTSGLIVMAEVGQTDKALATAIGYTAALSTARWLRERADRIHPADPEETR